MIQLLIVAEAPAEGEATTRFGGRPLAAMHAPFDWPLCSECGQPLQLLGQLALPTEVAGGRLIALFMCASEAGCATWEADGGANRAVLVQGDSLEVLAPPPGERTLRPTRYGARLVAWPESDYDESRGTWARVNEVTPRQVLGQLLGRPAWLQGDETPLCDCGKTMRFVAQLEEGPEYETAMNFGGGCAYLFLCEGHAAKMLWQQ